MCWFVVNVKNDWHEITGWRLREFMDRLGKALLGTHYGHLATKVLVGGEDIDSMDPVAVSWAFAMVLRCNRFIYLRQVVER